MNTLKLIWKAGSYPIERKYPLNSIVLKKVGYEMLSIQPQANEIRTNKTPTLSTGP